MIHFRYDDLIEDTVNDLKQLRKDCGGLTELDSKKYKLVNYLNYLEASNKIDSFKVIFKTESLELPLAEIILFKGISPICRIIYHFNELKFWQEISEEEKDKLDFCVIRYL